MPVTRCALTRVFSETGARLVGMVLALEWVRRPGVMARDVLAYSVPAIVDGSHLAATACANLWYKLSLHTAYAIRFCVDSLTFAGQPYIKGCEYNF